METGLENLLRITSYILTILCVNVPHYFSLWDARHENRERVMAEGMQPARNNRNGMLLPKTDTTSHANNQASNDQSSRASHIWFDADMHNLQSLVED
uniref:Uncharacterized protein n=1 Tax=Physcomitrium patens TaxID=3218 RepID=A0A2K1JD49_PHYPA|nr:hypothetical protein PHYPA_019733 [Physcomitrium patens]